eukprot:288133-Pleurochrysis_carterae.AAC.3
MSIANGRSVQPTAKITQCVSDIFVAAAPTSASLCSVILKQLWDVRSSKQPTTLTLAPAECGAQCTPIALGTAQDAPQHNMPSSGDSPLFKF